MTKYRGTMVAAMVAASAFVTGEASATSEFEQLRGITHVQSEFSSGSRRLESVAHEAVERGLDVIVLTDANLLRIEYGLPFLRNLIGIEREENALADVGSIREYLQEIERVAALYPELILIPGVESAPYYFWDVDIFGRRLTAHRWSQHLMAVGLDTEEGLAALPVMGSGHAAIWHWTSLLLLWPLLGLAFVILAGQSHSLALRVSVIALSVLFLVNNFPFKVPLMDPYHGDLGPGPYQNYINYIETQGGLAFWSHPSAGRSTDRPHMGGLLHVGVADGHHSRDLLATYGYTGFAALNGNQITAAAPGGEWDLVLREYLAGTRKAPAWAIGSMPGKRETGSAMDDVTTVFLAQSRTKNAVLDAMEKGRMYAVHGWDSQLVLEEFSVEAMALEIVGGEEQVVVMQALSGETISSEGEFTVVVGIARTDGGSDPVNIRLIRSGEVVAEDLVNTPARIAYDAVMQEEMEYIRLEASSYSDKLISNPIFIDGAPY